MNNYPTEEFHNIQYQHENLSRRGYGQDGRVYEGLTVSTSTNVPAEWVSVDIKNRTGTIFGSGVSYINQSKFITSDGYIKAGDYYIEHLVEVTNESVGVSFKSKQGEVLIGTNIGTYIGLKNEVKLCTPKVVRFTEDTLLTKTAAFDDIMKYTNHLYISEYETIHEPVKDFNKLSYIQGDEINEIMSFSHYGDYQNYVGQSRRPEITDLRAAGVGRFLRGYLPVTLNNPYKYDRGNWRLHTFNQVLDTAMYQGSVLTGNVLTAKYNVYPQPMYKDPLHENFQGFTTDCAEVRDEDNTQGISAAYGLRLGDYYPYDFLKQAKFNDFKRINSFPSFRKNVTLPVNSLGVIDYSQTYLNETGVSTIGGWEGPIYSGIDNWTWRVCKAVVLTFINLGSDKTRQFRVTTDTGPSQAMFSDKSPTVIIPFERNTGFNFWNNNIEIRALDGKPMGNFYVSAIMLP